MSLDTIFTLEVVLVVVLLAATAGGAIYLAVSNRRARRETGREVNTANIPVDMALEEYAEDTTIERATPREPRREFYKSMGLQTTEDMKIRLYSLEEYRDELGGTHAATDSGFVAATKAYRQLDDEWYDYSPRKAADVLELTPQDYEVDGECSALLLRRLPPGLPPEARDAL
jgi:hypothetical protein